MLSWALPPSSDYSSLHSNQKMMRNARLAPFPPSSVHFLLHSYLKMMRNALWAPFLLQCSFLITFLFETDEKCSPGALPSSSDRFLLRSYLKMMRNALLASFPPAVFISYYILI